MFYFTIACPILEDIVDDEVAIVWWAFRPQTVVRDRSDPLAFSDEYLLERYRLSGEWNTGSQNQAAHSPEPRNDGSTDGLCYAPFFFCKRLVSLLHRGC